MQMQRYDFVRQLADGQMSNVWLALDRQTSMQVAVKIMKLGEDEGRNAKTFERFQREIAIAQELRHPQILPLLDYGFMQSESAGQRIPYLVSPYIPEGSLVSLLDTCEPWQRWTLPQVADAILQAAECLWFLHTRTPPIVHEDVKPGNFLYRSINRPERAVLLYLFDFGISRRISPTFDLASEVVGTLEFIAPEQIRQQIDCASDQYALAVMATLLLTGRYPIHVAQRSEYVEAQQWVKPYAPSELYPERISSTAVDAVVLRALAKDPAHRFSTVLEFAQELQRAIQTFCAQQPTRLSLAQDVRGAQETVDMSGHADRTERADPAISPLAAAPHKHQSVDAGRIAFAFDAPDTHDGRLLNEPLPVRPTKSAASDTQRSMPSSTSLNVLTPLPVQDMPTPLRQSLPARARMLCWSPDGTRVAAVLYGAVIVYVLADATLYPVTTENAARATSCCWSADGTLLAIAGNRQLCFWEYATQSALPLTFPCSQNTIEGLDWSAQDVLALWLDDQILLYTLSPASLSRRNLPLPRQIATGAARCGNLGTLRFSPDGRFLAAGASNGELLCWSMAQLAGPLRLAARGQKIQSLCWSLDASVLYVATKDYRVRSWDLRTRQAALSWSALPAMPRSLSVSVDQRLTIASSDPYLVLGSCSAPQPAYTVPGQLLVAWSPVQAQLATLDIQDERTLLIWRMTDVGRL